MLPANSAGCSLIAVKQSNQPNDGYLSPLASALARIAFLILLAALAAGFPSQAQTPSRGSLLRGKVLDGTGAAIIGARVTASSQEGRGQALSTSSDSGGDFSLTLEPGTNYRVQIVADGFQQLTQTVTLPPAGSEFSQFVLRVAGPRGVITITEPEDYRIEAISSTTRTITPLRDVPQSITVVTQELMEDQLMMSIGDVVRYVPGVIAHQGEGNRDQVIIRGNNSTADFFLNGVRDDVRYYRDLYNVDRVEALKGPNAMVFGRGGGGGVINRVTKEAGFTPIRELTLLGGSYNNKRLMTDFDHPFNDTAALRFDAVYENSDSFRRFVNLERYGINPTLTLAPGKRTNITLGYEHFRDRRVADRGMPSFQGRPADLPVSTYFGNPEDSRVRAKVNLGSATLEHKAGRWTIRNRTLVGDYDKWYQNFVPGAVTADGTRVSLSAYNDATQRRNVFNQTDVTYPRSTGRVRHRLLAGVEVGRQLTDNLRNTGFFANTATSILLPITNPTISDVSFRPSATDADNHVKTNIGATYIQDQMELSSKVQVIGGVRFDHFDLQYHNNRNSENLRRIDNLVSPRVGIVLKPIALLSIYGSYSVSYLPSSGDQFSSLTTITQQVKPEKFNNYELGVKWDIGHQLAVTTAVYRLERTNTRATDPSDPSRIVQTGSQRTNGYELGVNGNITRAWRVAGGYAYQDAFISSATTAARAGAQVAQVPHHTFSLWNNYRVLARLGAGLGVVYRSDMYAAVDNTVVLPGYIRADTAVYFSVTEKVRLQANIENLFDKKYYMNADGNNNISPGSPRAFRVALIGRL